jgi:hypothetical protein
VHKVFNGQNVVFAKDLLDDGVVGERNALLVDFSVSTLVN